MGDFTIGFKTGIKAFGSNVSAVVNAALLSAVYIVGVGLTSIISRLVGKSFLSTKLGQKSYWETLDLKRPIKDYYRQF